MCVVDRKSAGAAVYDVPDAASVSAGGTGGRPSPTIPQLASSP